MKVEVFALKLTENIIDTEFNRLLHFVSTEKRDKLMKFRKTEDRYRGMLAELLARKTICEKFGLQNEQLFFSPNKYGKPLLEGYDNIHFNVSHSGEWVVCAIHDKPVGIDVERIHKMDEGIVRRFFAGEEAQYIVEGLSEVEKQSRFYELWTLKESYIKAEGKGMSIPLNSFAILINNDGILVKSEINSERYSFRRYELDAGHKLALCGDMDSLPEGIRVVGASDIFNFFR